MSYAIWGIGHRGTNLYQYFKEEISVFIESNEQKIGTDYNGIPIVSFDEFIHKYDDLEVLVSPYFDEEIKRQLDKYGIKYLCTNKCPMEFTDDYYYDLANKISRKLHEDKDILIIGRTILSLWLEKMYQEKNKKVMLFENDDIIKEKVVNECNVLVASCERGEFIENKIIDKDWIDLFHLGDLVQDKYRNPQIQQYKDIYKGNRCFIVATGPSLKIEDLDILLTQKEKCIGMNKIFYSFDKTEWRPDFYVAEDTNVMRFYADELSKIHGVKFLSDCYDYKPKKDEIVHQFHLSMHGDSYRYGVCEDFSYGYSCGYSVIFGCILLAIYMGFKELYLLGADTNYIGKPSDLENHFYGESDIVASQNPSVCLPFHGSTVLYNYDYIARFAERKGIKIYNATRGGKLEQFERVDFDSIFE